MGPSWRGPERFALTASWLMLTNYVEGIWESVIAFTEFRWLLRKVDLGTF